VGLVEGAACAALPTFVHVWCFVLCIRPISANNATRNKQQPTPAAAAAADTRHTGHMHDIAPDTAAPPSAAISGLVPVAVALCIVHCGLHTATAGGGAWRCSCLSAVAPPVVSAASSAVCCCHLLSAVWCLAVRCALCVVGRGATCRCRYTAHGTRQLATWGAVRRAPLVIGPPGAAAAAAAAGSRRESAPAPAPSSELRRAKGAGAGAGGGGGRGARAGMGVGGWGCCFFGGFFWGVCVWVWGCGSHASIQHTSSLGCRLFIRMRVLPA
jgi:hypothetical protein